MTLDANEIELTIEEQLRLIKEIMSKPDPEEIKHTNKKKKKKYCHRCNTKLCWLSGATYCWGCNWDSLTDPITANH